MKAAKVLKAVGFVVLCELVGGVLGSVFTLSSLPTWYAALHKPWFAPPGSLIGIIWTILYAMMGIAAFLVWESRKPKRLIPYAKAAFSLQLLVNVSWSGIFFGLRSVAGGLISIVAMWILIAATIALFYRINRRAALLMVPYLVWVTIAGALNFFIWRLN
jgi:tryptophan-rich sensory protein